MPHPNLNLAHLNLICRDCNFQTFDVKYGRAKALIHAQKFNHVVSGELGYYLIYDLKKGSDNEAFNN